MDSNKATHSAGDGVMRARYQSFLSVHRDFRWLRSQDSGEDSSGSEEEENCTVSDLNEWMNISKTMIESSDESGDDSGFIENNEKESTRSFKHELKSENKKKLLKKICRKKPKILIECTICHKVISKNSMTKHVRAIHEKMKRFTCDLCLKSFYGKYNLKEHLNCHINNPKFKRKPSIDTSNSSRPFKCDFGGCNKYFKTNSALRKHHESHSSEKNNLTEKSFK
jgi:uncharacterized Zn-finger protein